MYVRIDHCCFTLENACFNECAIIISLENKHIYTNKDGWFLRWWVVHLLACRKPLLTCQISHLVPYIPTLISLYKYSHTKSYWVLVSTVVAKDSMEEMTSHHRGKSFFFVFLSFFVKQLSRPWTCHSVNAQQRRPSPSSSSPSSSLLTPALFFQGSERTQAPIAPLSEVVVIIYA